MELQAVSGRAWLRSHCERADGTETADSGQQSRYHGGAGQGRICLAADILLLEKEELAVDMQMDIVMLCNSIELEKRQMEREVVVGLVERCVAENARVALTRTRIYNVTMGYNGRLVSRYETGKA